MPRNADIISSAILSVFGLALVFFIIPNQIDLPEHEVTMSPRLVPYLCGIAITVLSAVTIIQRLTERSGDLGPPLWGWFSGAEVRALGGIAGLFVICIALFAFVAPVVAGAVLVVGLLALFGERNLVTYLVMPAALLMATYLIFYKVLGTAIG